MDDPKLRILFAGSERADGLQFLAGSHDGWDVAFSETSENAMDSMRTDPFDVIVSDLAMRMNDDTALLEIVKTDFPQTVRVLLTDDAEAVGFVDHMGIAHQQLSKPFDLAALEFVIGRASLMSGLVQDPALRYVLADITTLPTLPASYLEIVNELQGSDPSIRVVGEIVSKDIAMTAKVLQVANSVIMGTRVKISDPIQATVQLGADMVKSLVLVTKVFDQFDAESLAGFPLATLLDHSMRVGTYAQKICKLEGADREFTDASFTAGLLHDVGKMILATNLPDTYRMACDMAEQRCMPLWLAEKELFGATHAEVGAYLSGLWGLPDDVCYAMLDHHCPQQSGTTEFDPLAAVHIANGFEHDFQPGIDIEADPTASVDIEYVDSLGVSDRLEDWRTACFPEE